MTKLIEWLTVVGALGVVWLSLITNKLDLGVTRSHPLIVLWAPLIALVAFGLYALSVVLYRTFTFNECKGASIDLQGEIREARRDLEQLGFKFKH